MARPEEIIQTAATGTALNEYTLGKWIEALETRIAEVDAELSKWEETPIIRALLCKLRGEGT